MSTLPRRRAKVVILAMAAPKRHTQVFAIVRLDRGEGMPEPRVTVKEVVTSLNIAEVEVARLNQINGDKSCVYFAQATRLFPDGSSAGTDAEDESGRVE